MPRGAGLLKLQRAKKSPGRLAKMQILNQGSGAGLEACISNRLPAAAPAAGHILSLRSLESGRGCHETEMGCGSTLRIRTCTQFQVSG